MNHTFTGAAAHAYAAVLLSLAGDSEQAAHRAGLARKVRPGASRRERQLVEILLLCAAGNHRRGAALAAEHSEEFPDDTGALRIVDRCFEQRSTA